MLYLFLSLIVNFLLFRFILVNGGVTQSKQTMMKSMYKEMRNCLVFKKENFIK